MSVPRLTLEQIQKLAELQEEFPPEIVERVLLLDEKEQRKLREQFDQFKQELPLKEEEAKRNLAAATSEPNRKQRRLDKANIRRLSRR